MSPKPVPARLHVILARESRTAVVIRRGPSRHTAVIGWDLKTDRFRLGQWLYGRIYERRCDLSPNGKHFIYFAMNGRWDSETGGAWTAISRTPHLKAIALYAKGDCWHGGGLFLDDKEFWLNGAVNHRKLKGDTSLRLRETFDGHTDYGGECPGVYYNRLLRDGWSWIAREGDEKDQLGKRGARDVFEKPIGKKNWILRKFAYSTLVKRIGRGCYFDAHQIIDGRNCDVIDCPDWEWAEINGNQLLFAKAGGLYSARVGANGLFDERCLFDANGMRFERLEAPY